mgnify:CR=1 FL=1
MVTIFMNASAITKYETRPNEGNSRQGMFTDYRQAYDKDQENEDA